MPSIENVKVILVGLLYIMDFFAIFNLFHTKDIYTEIVNAKFI